MSRKFESIDTGNRKPFFGRIIKPDSLFALYILYMAA